MVKITRRGINVSETLSSSYLDLATLDAAIDRLIDSGCKRDAIHLDANYSHTYYDGIDVTIELHGSRMETDEELEARREKEKEALKAHRARLRDAKKKAENREYSDFLRLKAKFKDCADEEGS